MTELSRNQLDRKSDIRGGRSWRVPLLAMLVVLSALAVGSAAFWWFGGDRLPLFSTTAPPQDAPTEVVKTSQQEATDQLRALQQTVDEQAAQMRKLSDDVAALTGKVDALQQSFASMPVPAAAPRTKKPKPTP